MKGSESMIGLITPISHDAATTLVAEEAYARELLALCNKRRDEWELVEV